MFDSDAMDISSDIDVLETMLKQDGLNSDGSGIVLRSKLWELLTQFVF